MAGLPIPSSCWMQRIPGTVGVEGAHGLSRKGEKDVVLQAGVSSRMSFLLAVEQKYRRWAGGPGAVGHYCWPTSWRVLKGQNTNWRLGTVWWHQLQAKGCTPQNMKMKHSFYSNLIDLNFEWLNEMALYDALWCYTKNVALFDPKGKKENKRILTQNQHKN